MARLIMAGWETGSLQELNGANNGLATVSSTKARTGTYSLRVLGGAILGATGYQTHVFAATETEFFFRLAVNLDADALPDGNWHLQFLDVDGDPQLTLRFIGSSQTFKLYRGAYDGTLLASGTLVLRADIWYVLEGHVVIHDSTGEFTLKVNSVTDISISSADTKATSNAGVRSFKILGPWGANSKYMYVDDVAFNDTSGSYQNTWIGLGGIFFLKANAAGNTQEWTPSSAVDHHTLVDDVPANTTDYVQDGTTDHLEQFDVEDSPDYVTSWDVIQVTFQAAIVESGSQDLKPVIRQDATDYVESAQTVVSVAPDYVLILGDYYYVQPDTVGALDEATVDGLEVGVKVG